jgi:hypothetical protein
MRLVCLVGEQPIPNLLPILYFNPSRVLLVKTETTYKVSENLKKVILCHSPESRKEVLEISVARPYSIDDVVKEIASHVDESGNDVMFNLTGGTKPMSLAAFECARKKSAPICYLQSESGKSLLDQYKFSENGDLEHISTEEIPELLTIAMHLEAHGLKTKSQNIENRESKGRKFEEYVANALKKMCSEVVMNVGTESKVEADILFRVGNQFGIAELKTGKSGGKKAALEQLSLLSHRESLGIYAKRFLIINSDLVGSHVGKIAEARRMKIICLRGEPNDHSDNLLPDSIEKPKASLKEIFGEHKCP